MEGKRDVIYLSSNEALVKIFVLVLTIGISILASLLDYKSCYTTILVQACNNMYDFYSFTDNKKYTTMVRRESIVIILSAITAIIVSIVALLELYDVMQSIWIKLMAIFLITIPLIVVYNDYRINVLDSQKFLQIDNDDIEKSRKIKYARNRFLYCSNYITKKPIS